MNRMIVAVGVAAVLTACAELNLTGKTDEGSVAASLDSQQRVVERDLTDPSTTQSVFDDASVVSASNDSPILMEVAARNTIDDVVFVPFADESATVPKKDIKGLTIAAASLPEDSIIFIVGHSHGSSNVGTGALAQLRADNVYRHFLNNGVEKSRMHRIASWGESVEPYAPSRGVQVMFLSKANPANILLRLAVEHES